MLQVLRTGGYLSSVPIPGGGSTLFQPAEKAADGTFTFQPAGVVLDKDGAVTKELELPKTLLSLGEGAVVVDRKLFYLGQVCRGAVEDSEAAGTTCGGAAPGPLQGYVVDLDSGASIALDLPEGLDANNASQARQLGLYRAADRPFLVSGVAGSWSAWILAKDGTWTDVEAPSSLPCQVGGYTVEASVKLQNPGDPNVPQTGDPTKSEKFLVHARVFDPGSGKWRANVPGPTTESGVRPSTLCSAERLSIAAHGASPVATSNFDPATETWTAGQITSESKVVTTYAVDGFGYVLLSDLGQASSGSMAVYDPVEDVTQPISMDLQNTAMFYSLSADALFVLAADGSHRVVEVP